MSPAPTRRRRKGNPYNPAKPHDRRSHDLLRNAQVARVEVDDPYEHGAKLVLLRSTRNDPLADMNAKGQIDECDYIAGRHWQAAYERAEIGGVRAIDPGKEAVDGGRMPEPLTDVQRKAAHDLLEARKSLGVEGSALVADILGKGLSVSQAASQRGRTTVRDRLYVGTRFRECLRTLAIKYGYSNEKA